MPTHKLTKAAVERIAAPDPSGAQVIHWDAELKGFGVLASGTTNAKTYICQRRMPDGRTRRITVGAVGEFMRVEDARRKAGTILAGLREGVDPKAERRKAAARDKTLRHWLDTYLTARRDLRQRSVEEYRRGAERHLDAWLDRPLREITPDMVEERHAAIGKASGPAAANSAMTTLSVLWNYALDRDETLPANPVRRLKRQWFPIAPRTGMVKTQDLPRFYAAVDALENHTAADFLKLVLFTGMRRREAAELRWDEIDLATKAIRLPAARTKAGRKLDLPMTTFARDLLIARRALGNDGGWVFGANSRSGHIEEPQFALARVAEATAIVAARAAGVEIEDDDDVAQDVIDKYGVRVSCHDLRRTFVTIAEAADISVTALKALVNHTLGSDVTSGYIQITVERLREPAQRVADRLMELCGIAKPAGENVERIGDRA